MILRENQQQCTIKKLKNVSLVLLCKASAHKPSVMKVLCKIFVDWKAESLIWKDFEDEVVTSRGDTVSSILSEEWSDIASLGEGYRLPYSTTKLGGLDAYLVVGILFVFRGGRNSWLHGRWSWQVASEQLHSLLQLESGISKKKIFWSSIYAKGNAALQDCKSVVIYKIIDIE